MKLRFSLLKQTPLILLFLVTFGLPLDSYASKNFANISNENFEWNMEEGREKTPFELEIDELNKEWEEQAKLVNEVIAEINIILARSRFYQKTDVNGVVQTKLVVPEEDIETFIGLLKERETGIEILEILELEYYELMGVDPFQEEDLYDGFD